MSTDELRARLRVASRSRSPRAFAISLLGPLTAVAGLAWAVVQPYRITLLEPADHGVWSLLVQPPLLVVLVGAFFHMAIAPGLLEDMAEEDEA